MNKKNLLTATHFPILGFKIYKANGKKVNIEPRCELCAYAEIIEDSEEDKLFCIKQHLTVEDNAKCDEFNITLLMMDDIYHGLIK